jgi:hypothetical protein
MGSYRARGVFWNMEGQIKWTSESCSENSI